MEPTPRAILRPVADPGPPADRATRRLPGLATIALFLLVFGNRAWLIHVWGSPMPFEDEWDYNAFGTFRDWISGTFHWGELFTAQNEHRLVPDRIASLLTVILSGRWNLWYQMTISALLHATAASVLFQVWARSLEAASRAVWWVAIALLFSATSGWQSALIGGQNHVYWINLFAITAAICVTPQAGVTRAWAAGLLVCALAPLCNGAGVLLAVAAAAVAALDAWSRRTIDLPRLAAFVLLGAVAALGFTLRVHVAFHDPLQARTAGQFLDVFCRSFGWPQIDSAWAGLLLQIPAVALLVRAAARQRTLSAHERGALFFVFLAALQAAGIAYSRGAGLVEGKPLSRYQDPFLLSCAANLWILLRQRAHLPRGTMAIVAWSGLALAGLIQITTDNFSLHLPYKRLQDRANRAMVLEYLATHDATVFTRDPFYHGPHPRPASVTRVLDDPHLREILPEEIFGTDYRFPWPVRHGRWIAAAGSVLGLIAVLRLPRRKSTAATAD